jgi:N-acetylneuraminic acid mutarotase
MVLLADGRVLIAGGWDEIGTGLLAAELYDPRTGSWTVTGSMAEPHGGSATLLPDGTVLVAGGADCPSGDPCGFLASAELYHPLTGTWTATGTMIARRNGHTATLLPDGTVLVAGGSGGAIARASAELYDPRTGSWTATGSMIGARAGHTATLLPDGTVLVAGGSDDGRTALVSAELYDPRTASWTATEGMKVPRLGYTATLLNDGTVLVAGGESRTGGDVYDPDTGSWTGTGEMAESRGFHTATLLPDGRVLVAGGADGNGDMHVTNTAELYDASTRSWSATASLAIDRKFHTAILLLDGRVLVAGGTDHPTDRGWHRLATAELYGPVSGD